MVSSSSMIAEELYEDEQEENGKAGGRFCCRVLAFCTIVLQAMLRKEGK
jgi:hypothetical protein